MRFRANRVFEAHFNLGKSFTIRTYSESRPVRDDLSNMLRGRHLFAVTLEKKRQSQEKTHGELPRSRRMGVGEWTGVSDQVLSNVEPVQECRREDFYFLAWRRL